MKEDDIQLMRPFCDEKQTVVNYLAHKTLQNHKNFHKIFRSQGT